MARTTASAVKGILLKDYPAPDEEQPSLTPYIETANVIVTRVATCATARDRTLTSTELELVERWLAAHFYVQSDQTWQSKSTEGASASFHGQTGMHLESSRYGQAAMDIDYSGCLASFSSAQSVTFGWLGRPPSEQTAYSERD